jgi:hypothetical protein
MSRTTLDKIATLGAKIGPSTADGMAKLFRVDPETTTEKWSGSMIIDCPRLIVVSEANRRDHPLTRWKRQKAQVDTLLYFLIGFRDCKPPKSSFLKITFTRLGGKRMNCDNLAGAFKAVRDSLAKWLGRDDGDSLLMWRYKQASGPRGITVEIRES